MCPRAPRPWLAGHQWRPAPCGQSGKAPAQAGALRLARQQQRRASPVCSSTQRESGEAVFVGRYGEWTLDDRDRLEVWGYRVALTVVALAFELGAATVLLPEDVQRATGDALWFTGAAGLGVSLFLIHMYMNDIKNVMKALYATGVVGSLYIATTQAEPVPMFVAHNPWAVWLVGPMFAAFTALCFKEGACYGKPESASLFLLVPATLLSHLAGLPEGVQDTFLLGTAVMMVVFAARKYTQAVKDDVGDKTVFQYLALPDEEKVMWDLAAERRQTQGLMGRDGGGGRGREEDFME